MDVWIFSAINGLAGHVEWLDAFMRFWSHPSPGLLGVVAAIVAWGWFNWWEALLGLPTVSSAVAIADAVGAQLKHVVQRPRPCLALPDVTLLGQCGGLHSFPSNHAINAAVLAAFFHVLYPKSGWITWPIVGLIGLARVYIGVHYMGDVIVGWIIGTMMGAGAAVLLLRWRRFRPSSPKPAAEVHLSSL
ncbi:phosphatase PAP2 family protein [Nitrospira sp.]|nr:phosphatase PAP2 family protein [Nitrospira sp.]